MKILWFSVCLVLYFESSNFAVMKIKSSVRSTVRFIYFNDVDFYKFYGCLTNNITKSCKLSLKWESDNRGKITDVEGCTSGTWPSSLIPVFKCSFPLILSNYIDCHRNTEKRTLHNYNISLYAFALAFEHDDEYFFHKSLKNMSIDSKTFAYELIQDMSITFTASLIDINNTHVTDVTSTSIPTTFSITNIIVEINDSTVNTTSEAELLMSTDNNDVADRDNNSGAFVSIISVTVLVSVFVIVVVTVSVLRFFKRKKKQWTGISAKTKAKNDHVRSNDSSIREVALNSDEHEPVYSRSCENMRVLTNEYGDIPLQDYSLAPASTIEVNHSLQEVYYDNSKVTEPSTDSPNCAKIYSKLNENKIILTNEYGDLLPEDYNIAPASAIEVNHGPQKVYYENIKVTEANTDSPNCNTIYSKLPENKSILITEYDDLQPEDNNTNSLTKNCLSSSSNKSNHNTLEVRSDSKEVDEAFPKSADCENVYSNDQEIRLLPVEINVFDNVSSEYSNTVSTSGFYQP